MKFLPILLLFLIVPIVAEAGVLPPCTATGNCGVCDMLFTVSAIMRWIVYAAGALALLFFVWGGVLFLTSGGSSGRIKQGKSILINTILGVVIVFVAWTGVNFIISQISNTPSSFFLGEAWYNLCASGGNECFGKGDGYPCGSCENCKPRQGHCVNGSCDTKMNACQWLRQHSEFKYECIDTSSSQNVCGIKYTECDAAPNCVRNLCPGGNEIVCCYPKK